MKPEEIGVPPTTTPPADGPARLARRLTELEREADAAEAQAARAQAQLDATWQSPVSRAWIAIGVAIGVVAGAVASLPIDTLVRPKMGADCPPFNRSTDARVRRWNEIYRMSPGTGHGERTP